MTSKSATDTPEPPKTLTAAAVRQLKPGAERREVRDRGCPGLYLVIQPSGHRSWVMRFRRPGSTTATAKLTLGTADLKNAEAPGEPAIGGHLTLAGARRLAAEVHRQRALGRDPAADRVAAKRRARIAAGEGATNTFGAAARAFIVEHARPNTRRWRETAAMLGLRPELEVVRGGLAERWATRPVSHITDDDVIDVIEECRQRCTPGRRRRGPQESEGAARAMHSCLSKFFGWLLARRPRVIEKNPVSGVAAPEVPEARDRWLDDAEVRWFWRACDEIGEPFGALLRLLLVTGARREEVARMTRAEISDDGATWKLTAERTKNHKAHDVPLSPLAREIIGGVKTIAGRPGYLFTTTGTTPVSGFSQLKKRLDRAMIKLARDEAAAAGRDPAAVSIPPWRLHDLRRTAVTGMARAGADLHVIERAVNHISGSFGGIAGVYQRHHFSTQVRAALEAWANLIGEITSAAPRGNVVPLRQGA
jgi:integrase